LVDDHSVVCNGIKMLLQSKKDVNIVAACKNGAEVLDLVKRGQQIDILISDINMPEMSGLTLLTELRELSPKTRVIILSMLEDLHYITTAFDEGACGYLIKNADINELFFAIDRVQENKKYLSSELTFKLINEFGHQSKQVSKGATENFTDRELEILACIADGMTNSEMSEKLFLSKRTVEGHRQSLLEKTNARNTATLIRYAIRNGIID
jgi:DNA-binding NarL/FixJ family response regulator